LYPFTRSSIFMTMRRDARSPIRSRAGGRLVARGLGLLALAVLPPLHAGAQQKPAGGPDSGVATGQSGTTPATHASAADSSSWLFTASGRADLGYDTNVFQTDAATGDAFTQVGGWAAVSRNDGRTLLRSRFELNGKFYRRFSRADEYEGLLDLTGTRQFGPLRAGTVLNGAYLDLRALDREGNLLPRSTLASLSGRALAFADLRLTRTLYLSSEASYRYKNYEETPQLTSLDYAEWAAELALSRYFAHRISLRVEGSLGRRNYSDLQAAQPSGEILPGNPLLEVRRLQGSARLRKRWGLRGMLQATFALRRSDDLFLEEMSSDQSVTTLRLRHPMGPWLLDAGGAFVNRDFDLRDVGAAEPLSEDYLSFDARLERALWDGARLSGGYELFRRSTNDPDGDYTVSTWQLGLVHVF
jgi:hypothetical protein